MRIYLRIYYSCTGLSPIECEREAIFYFILPPVESARIHTKNSFSFRYGKVEIRAKLPVGDWIVPELWLIPKDDFYGPYYSSGKIRLAMARGNENLKSGTIDLSNSRLEAGVLMGPENDVQVKSINWTNSGGWNKEFHNFTLLWTPDNLSFSVDDYPAVSLINGKLGRLSESLSFKKSPVESWKRGSNVAPFDKEFYISLGLSVGGIRDFPDNSLNGGQRKPWTDSDAKV
ncbi:hypothetical protein AAG570_002524 [Ranatra chinensis]|uniref:GH16 domain-containing protein n=1 Tax=Ranatra chinensis TaxID=642074 RepID=A0ABD0Y8Q7_9HEMI